MDMRRSFTLSPDVAQAVMFELRKSRDALHRSHRVLRCDLGLVMPGLRFGCSVPATWYALSGDCVCRDLVADVLHIVITFLADHGADRTNLAGAVRSHVRKRVIDVFRRDRADRGAAVKPRQVRQNRFGRALPDDEHRAVLGLLADEAGYSAPLPGQGYLMRRLAERCSADLGQPVSYYLDRMPSILQTVKRVCSAGTRVNVGTRAAPEYVSWYDAYIERPLGRRPDAMTWTLSDDAVMWSVGQVADLRAAQAFDAVLNAEAGCSDSDSAIVDLIVEEIATVAHHRQEQQEQAVRAAVLKLVDRGLLSRARATSLLADQTRVADVLSRAREVIGSSAGGRHG